MSNGGPPAAVWADEAAVVLYWRDTTGVFHAVSSGNGVHVDLVWTGSAYPARPSATVCPAGYANYIGPTADTPGDWISGDTWDAY